MSTNWNELRLQIEQALKTTLGGLVEGTAEDLDGAIRQASNRLTVAIRNNDLELVAEAKEELALRMQTLGIRAKAGSGGLLDLTLGVGMNFLFNGAVAALASVKI